MAIISAFSGSGVEVVPAGKTMLRLAVNTIDRMNLEGATWQITATGKSYNATADAGGRADVLVDSGVTYNVTLTHAGLYYNDQPQKVVAESTACVWVYFDLFQHPDVKTVVQVITDAGILVTADSGANHMQMNANGSGIAEFSGMATGSEWTFAANGESKTIVIDRLMQTITVGKTVIYGVDVSLSDSNPATRVTYTDDAVGMTPMSNVGGVFDPGSWDGNDLISGIQPVAKAGSVWTDLDKKTLAGVPTNTSADAFTEVPTWWFMMERTSTAIRIRFSNTQVNSKYQKYASRWGVQDQGMFHYGMFHGLNSSSKLYSYSGATPTVNTSITNFINYAKARGAGYDITTFYQTTYLIGLFVLLFRNTDAQSVLGKGLTSSGSAAQSRSALTFSNNYGMAGDTNDASKPVSFFWIHDFFGNVYDFIGGAKTNSSCSLMTIIDGVSSVNEGGFTNRNTTPNSSRGGYVKDVDGTTETGFFPKDCSGSSSTFWCDNGRVNSSYFPDWGGYWSDGSNAGPFYWNFSYSAAGTNSSIGARLSYRAGRARPASPGA